MYESNKFVVPDYQREYSWKKKEIDTFLADFKEVYDNDSVKPKEYFFGPMIFTGIEKEVIDGQQRLATISIFAAAINDMYHKIAKEIGKEPDKEKRDELVNYVKCNGKLRFTAAKNDCEIFEYLTNEIKDPKDKSDNSEYTNTNFMQNYKTIIKWLTELTYPQNYKERKSELQDAISKIKDELRNMHQKGNEETVARLSLERKKNQDELKEIEKKSCIDFIDTTLPKILKTLEAFMILEFGSERKNAHLIFETLNYRGKDLTTSELFKNYILYKANNAETDNILRKWDAINKNVENKIEDFLLHYYMANYEKVSKNNLFAEYKKKTIEEESVEKLIKDMLKSSKNYGKIINPDNYPIQPIELRQALKYLSELNSTAFYPLLLCAFGYEFKPKEIQKLAENCIVLLIRHKTIFRKKADPLIDLSIKVARKIREGNVEKQDRLFAEDFKEIDDDGDDVFVTKFAKHEFRDNSHGKYIIREIYQRLGDVTNPEYELEHIIPQSVYGSDNTNSRSDNVKDWRKFMKKHSIEEDWIYRIGNFTLLTHDEQIKAGDNPISTKLDVFRKSKNNTTRKLRESDFYKEKFERRCKELAKRGAEIWKLNFE